MCLTLNIDKKKKKAERDITVWKTCLYTGSYQMLYTPYLCKFVEVGNVYYSDLIRVSTESGFVITKGLHSFKNREDAKTNIKYDFGVVVKCKIPKGSYYYEGKFGCYAAYASDSIKYEEITDDYRKANNYVLNN